MCNCKKKQQEIIIPTPEPTPVPPATEETIQWEGAPSNDE